MMKTLFGWTGMFLAGWFGWWLGEFIGLGTAVIVSAIGSGVGLYWGRRLYADHIDWR